MRVANCRGRCISSLRKRLGLRSEFLAPRRPLQIAIWSNERPAALTAVQPPVAVLLRRDNVRRVLPRLGVNALFTALKLDCVTKSYVTWSHYDRKLGPPTCPRTQARSLRDLLGLDLIATMLARNSSIAARCLIPEK